MSDKTVDLNVKITSEMASILDNLAELEQTDKRGIIRKILTRGVRQEQLERAAELVLYHNYSVEGAANKVCLPVIELIDFFAEKGLPRHQNAPELEKQLKELLKNG